MGWYKAGHREKDTKDSTASFVHNRNRENIKPGETHSTLFGKIARYFADLKLVAFTGSYNDLTGRPPSFPPSSHKHAKSDITDFPSSMPASDVKAWAKEASKPSYTAAEVGALPAGSDLRLEGSVIFGDGAFRIFKGYYSKGYHVANFNDVLHGSGIGFTSRGPDDCSLHPHKDGGGDLGWGFRWNDIFAVNSSISTSGREQKKEISYIGTPAPYDTSMSDEMLINLIMGIKPAVFKRKNGESGRPHHGFIAQDIKELIQKLGIKDHAGFIETPRTETIEIEEEIGEEYVDETDGQTKTRTVIQKREEQREIPGEYIYGLRYEEFIADIVRFCQLQDERLKTQEEKINNLEKRIEILENIINQRA